MQHSTNADFRAIGIRVDKSGEKTETSGIIHPIDVREDLLRRVTERIPKADAGETAMEVGITLSR